MTEGYAPFEHRVTGGKLCVWRHETVCLLHQELRYGRSASQSDRLRALHAKDDWSSCRLNSDHVDRAMTDPNPSPGNESPAEPPTSAPINPVFAAAARHFLLIPALETTEFTSRTTIGSSRRRSWERSRRSTRPGGPMAPLATRGENASVSPAETPEADLKTVKNRVKSTTAGVE